MTAGEGRRFGLPVGGAFLALAALFWWREWPTASAIAAAAGVLFVTAGLLVPTRLRPVQRVWMAMAHAISKLTTPIVMGIIFFGVITPIGLIARLLRHRPLTRTGASLWVDREPDRRRSDLERQF